MDGRDPVGQRRQVKPVLLGNDAVAPLRAMRVDVHEAREHRVPRGVDDLSALGDGHAAASAHSGDAIALHEHHPVLDDLVALHGDHLATHDGERSLRAVRVHGEADVRALLGQLGQLALLVRCGVDQEGEGVLEGAGEQLRTEEPVELCCRRTSRGPCPRWR